MSEPNQETKFCKYCQQHLPLWRFKCHVKVGVLGTCIDCQKKNQAEWQKANREKRRAQKAVYVEKNKEKLKAERRVEPRKRALYMKSACKKRAAKAGVPFDPKLDLDWFTDIIKTKTHCECCGTEFKIGKKHFCDSSLSFDRVYPELGYVKHNVATICWKCNNIKRDFTPDELRRVADWMERRRAEVRAEALADCYFI